MDATLGISWLLSASTNCCSKAANCRPLYGRPATILGRAMSFTSCRRPSRCCTYLRREAGEARAGGDQGGGRENVGQVGRGAEGQEPGAGDGNWAEGNEAGGEVGLRGAMGQGVIGHVEVKRRTSAMGQGGGKQGRRSGAGARRGSGQWGRGIEHLSVHTSVPSIERVRNAVANTISNHTPPFPPPAPNLLWVQLSICQFTQASPL